MGTSQNATRREIEIVLNGNSYTVRELDLKAYGDAENFIRSNHIRIYRETSTNADPALREQTVAKMIREAYTAEELGAAMAAPSASEYVAYLSLRHNAGVTLESMSSIVTMENIAEVNTVIASLQAGEEDENPPPTEQPIP